MEIYFIDLRPKLLLSKLIEPILFLSLSNSLQFVLLISFDLTILYNDLFQSLLSLIFLLNNVLSHNPPFLWPLFNPYEFFKV